LKLYLPLLAKPVLIKLKKAPYRTDLRGKPLDFELGVFLAVILLIIQDDLKSFFFAQDIKGHVFVLGHIHGFIRAADQVKGRFERRRHLAAAGAEGDWQTEIAPVAEAFFATFEPLLGLFSVKTREDRDEFIPTEPVDMGVRGLRLHQDVGKSPEDLIPHHVTIDIVDQFEVIEISEDQHDLIIRLDCIDGRKAGFLIEQSGCEVMGGLVGVFRKILLQELQPAEANDKSLLLGPGIDAAGIKSPFRAGYKRKFKAKASPLTSLAGQSVAYPNFFLRLRLFSLPIKAIWRHVGFPLSELFGSGVGAKCATSLSRSRFWALSSSSKGTPPSRDNPWALSERIRE
jgi:hypothetical protein